MNRNWEITRRIELFLDVLLTSLAFLLAYFIKNSLPEELLGGLTTEPNYYLVVLLIIIIWYVTLDLLHIRFSYTTRISPRSIGEISRGITICTTILVLCMYIFKITDVSRLLIFLFYAFDVIFLNLGRWLTHRLIFSKRERSYFQRYVLILGSRTATKELIRMIAIQAETNIKIVGCLETNREDVGKTVGNGVKIIGTLDDLREILQRQIVDEVLITMPLNEIDNSEWYLSFINTFGITIRIIPDWYIRKYLTIQPDSHAVKVDQFLSEPALILGTVREKHEALVIKSIMDYVLAIAAMIVTFPLFLIFSALIKWLSPGPILYKQIRCGQYGRKFTVYKFRTMIPEAEKELERLLSLNEADGPAFKIRNDPRIIPYIGAFLRKSGLDEIPQFINVIRGEMSIVGPRPPIPAEVEKYELWQRRRLSMKPGITCTWQIQPHRNELLFDRWMDMDLEYIDRWSLWRDMVLILKTVPAMIFGRGR